MAKRNGMRLFDARKLAYYEKENYVAYYQKNWPRLFRVSIGMVREAYSLSLLEGMYGAYLIARAEMAAAPFPNNNLPLAREYMRRFFAFINRVHGLQIPPAEAAEVDVNWWIVHRRLFGCEDNQELVEAVAKSFAMQYGRETAQLRQAAYHRVQGMLYSDRWVNEGKKPDSPLLALEEEELYKGYAALKQAIQEGANDEQPVDKRLREIGDLGELAG
jgi:hypothetical protein